jgi:hypothetical protein
VLSLCDDEDGVAGTPGPAIIRDGSSAARRHSNYFQVISLCFQVTEGYCATLHFARIDLKVL